ncbi:MAG: C39 family peptidase [Candidatus Rifleibacteriota bacterium]
MKKLFLAIMVLIGCLFLPCRTYGAANVSLHRNFDSVNEIPIGADVCPFCGSGTDEGIDNSGKSLPDSKKAGLVLFFEARKEIMARYRQELAKIKAGTGSDEYTDEEIASDEVEDDLDDADVSYETDEDSDADSSSKGKGLLKSFIEKAILKKAAFEEGLSKLEKIRQLRIERNKRIAEARKKYILNPVASFLKGDGNSFRGEATPGEIVAVKRIMAVKKLLKTGEWPYQCKCGIALTEEQQDNISEPEDIATPEGMVLETKPIVEGQTIGDSEELDAIYEEKEIGQTGSQFEQDTGDTGGSSVFGDAGDIDTGSGAGQSDAGVISDSTGDATEIGEFTDSVIARCVYISQRSGWRCNAHYRGCGWTSLAMILRTLGVNVDPDVLFAQTEMYNSEVAKTGIGYQEVERLAHKYLPSATFSTKGKINDLMEMINLGRPAIVSTTEYGGHFMVVIGYGDKDGQSCIIAHDPEKKANRVYPLDEFTKIWDKIYMNFNETTPDPSGPALPDDANTVVSNSGSGSSGGSSSDGDEGEEDGSSTGEANQPEISENSVVLEVPKLNQRKNAPPLAANVAGMSCGPTSTLMILNYFGINPGIEAVVDKAECTSGGSMFYKNVEAAQGYGLKSENVGIGYGAFQKALEANKPVFVRTLDWEGHFVVVTGIKNGKVIVNDPYPRNYGAHGYNDLGSNLYREYDADEFFSSGFVTNACSIYN